MPGQKSTMETRLMGSVNLGMEGTGSEKREIGKGAKAGRNKRTESLIAEETIL